MVLEKIVDRNIMQDYTVRTCCELTLIEDRVNSQETSSTNDKSSDGK